MRLSEACAEDQAKAKPERTMTESEETSTPVPATPTTSLPAPTEKATLKPKDVLGKTFKVTGARSVSGKYGPQLRLQLDGGHSTYISEKSGIAKGLVSGKLKVPLNIKAVNAFGEKGMYVAWDLAPRTL